ncbi:short-chain dehydrogenase/reductase SDR [Paenibacillus mucilaginosus 3016]|uniref:Short-chain dehydrogenase/reductase SDR n=2 Tax=Paenibacillus mucilaginosus TaxID=61624 RepID=H6NPY8_9BACL|nr:SDR family NAD(P)-dependent oxidoreductase [Paenibacillus mucilaginosus]AFC31179.1 short-chain dehydrogenase/reductase SDR [Paenibacillus mucilaginosus 3016]AFH63500.1 short-chain dehydrogenase [Paenibacillus mucilaginosus K02]WFA19753.1 SDR family NAD(P)-dependent oxidoreductase [Paenibacillus mucilaginosus]
MNILVTGANRGLGYALTAELLQRGHSVIAGVRGEAGQPSERNRRLYDLAGAFPGRLQTASLDVADETGIAEAAAAWKSSGIELDAIVNNAAILAGRETAIEQLDFADMAASMEINLYGPMRIVKHCLPLFGDRAGCIVNISSEAGSFTNAYGGDYPYALSKAALNMFSQQLHRQLHARDIAVYAVHPGWIRTDMGGEQAPGDPEASARGIADLIERRTVPAPGPFVFIDYRGEAMPI